MIWNNEISIQIFNFSHPFQYLDTLELSTKKKSNLPRIHMGIITKKRNENESFFKRIINGS